MTVLLKFNNGSPIPMNTTLLIGQLPLVSLPIWRLAHHNWPIISATLRLRLKPCLPVEQKEQLSAQPACVETHKVPRSVSGIYTVSIALPVPTFNSHLRVPSVDNSSRCTTGAVMHACCCNFSRKELAISVIAANSDSPILCIQRSTWRARKGFSPCAANQSAICCASKLRRFSAMFF